MAGFALTAYLHKCPAAVRQAGVEVALLQLGHVLRRRPVAVTSAVPEMSARRYGLDAKGSHSVVKYG